MRFFMICALSMMFIFASSYQGWAVNDWTGNVNFTLGAKALDEDDWDPVDSQGEFGIHVDFRKQEWPVNIVIALLGSADEGDIGGYDVEGTTSELRFGVKKIWEPTEVVRPFLGIGLGFINGEFDLEGIDDNDTALGLWINGGVYWTLGKSFNLGFEVGYSQADVDIFGVDVNAGGGHAGLLLGYHW